MSTTTLYEATPQTGTVSSTNSTSLYSNTGNFTTGTVNSAVYSVNAGTGISVDPTTGNVVVSIGQAVAPTDNVQFANVTATGNLSNNYFTLANSTGTSGQVLTTNGSGTTSWSTVSSLGVVTDVSGSGAGISVSPTTGSVVVSNTGVTSIVAGTNISVSSATGAVTVNATDTNTTYNIDASSITGGANLNLTGSDSSTDSVAYLGSGGTTVTRTDANTITISSIASLGGDVVGPGSATDNALARYDGTTGKLIQNSSAILTDTGDLTLAGDLTVTGSDITTGITNGFMTISQLTSSTDVPQNGVRITVESTGTPAVGLGTNLEFAIETQPSVVTLAGAVQVESTDITPGAESFKMDFDLKSAGTYQTRMSLDDQGSLTLAKSIKINGATSGSSSFTVPATGSTLSYVLPGTGGAAATVLTNDGSGNLSWALPGGGGSTFGNVTVGVVTDNTISTTTGDLVLASATNVINAGNASLFVAGLTIDAQTSIDTATITTTSTATVSLITSGRNVMSVLVNIIQGSNVHCVNATALRNGATAMLTTYGEMYNTTPLATFTADISGGNIRLLVTPTSATSTVFSAVRTSLT